MKNIFLGAVIMLVLSSSSCEKFSLVERFYRIKIDNNSANPVYHYVVDDHSTFFYPDTVLPAAKLKLFTIEPDGRMYVDSRVKWEKILKSLPADTLSIYFLDPAIYENVAWSEIREDYKILQRYDLSIEDLNELKFIVPYPATSAMKDMKMFPPYKEGENKN